MLNRTLDQPTEQGRLKAHGIHPEIREWLIGAIWASGLQVRACFDFWGAEQVYNYETADAEWSSIMIRVRHPGVIRQLIEDRDPLSAVEALLSEQLSFVGAIDHAVALYCCLASTQFKPSNEVLAWCQSLPDLPALSELQAAWRKFPTHSAERDKAVVQAHYDISNDFYRLWLDPLWVYSCAHFEDPDGTLADAQKAKLDLICRKLRLEPGEQFLDIGCGWGALLRWAVTNYGVSAHGITLSEEQLAFNRRWIAEEGLGDRIRVDLLDYRDLPRDPAYDKIASIGMMEHVGIKNYTTYFRSAIAALKPNGLFLNHGITLNELFEPQIRFINRYIFPDGECAHVSTYLKAARDAGWEIVDVDSWRPHYAKTLRCWQANLERSSDQAVALVGERVVRLWQLYFILCAQCFECGTNGVYQMLLRRAADRKWNLPLTREQWLC